VRPVRAEDAPAVLAFFERLSPESTALRFFCGFPDLDRAVRWATQLIEAATQAGVAVLSAEVLPQNHRMLHVFRDSGFPVTTRTLPWSWSSCQRRERRRRWSASNHATAYQATANDAPAVPGAWGVTCSYISLV
jgi:hypothetical protein